MLRLLLTICLIGVSREVVAAAEAAKCDIYDATLYVGKPVEVQQRFPTLVVYYPRQVWPEVITPASIPVESLFKAKLSAYRHERFVVLDFEGYPLDGRDARPIESISRLQTIVRWAKEALPEVKVGFYGTVPITNYGAAVAQEGAAIRKHWVDANTTAMPLARSVDALFPSLYTFHNEPEKWKRYAISSIGEARRIGGAALVLAFLWPEYHESSSLGGQPIESTFWRMQMEVACSHADGVVIWGGYDVSKKERRRWDDAADWWRVTSEFLQK